MCLILCNGNGTKLGLFKLDWFFFLICVQMTKIKGFKNPKNQTKGSIKNKNKIELGLK
jgi:hypothetical protein